MKIIQAIAAELWRERAAGHTLDALRVTPQAIPGSVTAAPVLHGSFTAGRRGFDGALAQLAGNPRRELLIHPDDWRALLLEQPFSPDVCIHEVLGLPVEHA